MTKLPFGFEKPGDSPGFLLWQVSTIWQRQIKKALDVYDISHSQFVIMALALWFSAHNYSATQVLIADWSKLDKMTISKALKKLEGMKLIDRIGHDKDLRAKTVILTNKGKELLKELVPIIEEVDHKFFDEISSLENKNLLQILDKLSIGNSK